MAWEGGDLGPQALHCLLVHWTQVPQKARRVLGGRQVRRVPHTHLTLALCSPAEPHHSQLVPAYLAGPPVSHPHSWPLSPHLCPI